MAMIEFESLEAYAAWVVAQTNLFTVVLEDPNKIARDEILVAADAWPHQDLKQLEATASQSLAQSKSHHEKEVNDDISDLRCELQAYWGALFTTSASARAAKRKQSMVVARSFVARLQANGKLWEDLGAPTRFVLELPIRKKADLRGLMEHLNGTFKQVWWEAVECALNKLQTESISTGVGTVCSRKRETAIDAAFRRLTQRWRSQTHITTKTILPRIDGSMVSVNFTVSRRPCPEIFRTSVPTSWESATRFTIPLVVRETQPAFMSYGARNFLSEEWQNNRVDSWSDSFFDSDEEDFYLS